MKPNLLFITLTLIFANSFVSKELNLIAICGVLAFVAPYDRATYYKSFFAVIWPLFVLLMIGFFSGLNNVDYINRDFSRDLFAFARGIICLFFGILLSKYVSNIATFYKCFVIFILFASLQHLSLVAANIHNFGSFNTYRKSTGMTNFDEAILLSLFFSALFNSRLRQLLGKRNFVYKMITAVILISFITYFSRTMVLTLVVLIFFMADTINVRRISYPKNRRIFSAIIIIAVLFTSLSLLAAANPSNILLRTFIEKFQRSSEEVFWNAEANATATMRDIQNNWRGYEAYQGLMKFREGTNAQQFFGYGFGALVDLGIYMLLGAVEYDQVPFLHNGYVYLLVKCGIIGVVFYLLFLYLIGFSKIRSDDFEDAELYYYYQMLSGLSCITLINTFTFFGLFNPNPLGATVPILFGFFWGCIQRRKIALRLNDNSAESTDTLVSRLN